MEWSEAIGLRMLSAPPVVKEELDKLMVAQMPRLLLELKASDGPFMQCEKAFQDPLRQWALDHSSELCNSDPYTIKPIMSNLAQCYDAINVSSHQFGSKEFVQRRGVDGLLHLAFLPVEDKRKCNLLWEAGIRLCRSACFDNNSVQLPSTNLTDVIGPNVTADALVTIGRKGFLTEICALTHSDHPITKYSQWAANPEHGAKVTSIIGFAVEYKSYSSTSAKYQLAMDLSTAQCQRKALGLQDRVLYGATCHQGIFCIHASWWNEMNQITFANDTDQYKFNLTSPLDLLNCFFFLRNLQEHILDTMGAELDSHDPTVALNALQKYNWRMEDRPPRKKARTKGSEPQFEGGSGGSNVDDLEAFSYDEDANEGHDDFTQQELEKWIETSEGYKREATAALAELGGKPSSLGIIKHILDNPIQSLVA